jgi:zinc transporter ZupT
MGIDMFIPSHLSLDFIHWAYILVIAVFTALSGLLFATKAAPYLDERRLSWLMAAGAGILLASMATEMLPEMVEIKGLHQPFLIMLSGLLTVTVFDKYLSPQLDRLFGEEPHDHSHVGHSHHHHHHNHSHHLDDDCCEHPTQNTLVGDLLTKSTPVMSVASACTALGCLLVCTFFDGVALAAAFQLKAGIGLIMTIGLLLHLAPEGIIASAVMLSADLSRKKARFAALAVGISLVLGYAFATGLGLFLGVIEAALPFACGVILNVVLTELLPAAKRSKEGIPLLLAVIGFFVLLEKVIPHGHG